MANEFIDDTFMDGFKDGPHVTEVQTGLANQGLYGPDDYVLEGGREAEAQILTNNSIRIFDAVYVLQGRRDVIAANDYTDVSIDNGAQGLNRNDIIVRRYTKDESSEVESTEYAVIKGTAVSGEANDPEVTEGDIRSGATFHEMKLYRVKIEGLNIVAVEPLFQVLYNMSHIKELLSELNGKISSPYNLANCTFRKINKVVNGSGSSRQLFTLSKLNSIFDVSADRQDYDLFLWNGDGTNEVHIDGATYTPNNTTFYATLNRTYTGSIRIRGIVIYNPSTDGAIT